MKWENINKKTICKPGDGSSLSLHRFVCSNHSTSFVTQTKTPAIDTKDTQGCVQPLHHFSRLCVCVCVCIQNHKISPFLTDDATRYRNSQFSFIPLHFLFPLRPETQKQFVRCKSLRVSLLAGGQFILPHKKCSLDTKSKKEKKGLSL